MKISKFTHLIKQIIKQYWPFIFGLSIYLLLAYKAPFSERTLIPNLEPYPDSFHYITSTKCFLQGKGFNLCRGNLISKPSVPPLYSLYLVPFYLISPAAQTVYYANLILGIISFYLFYSLCKKYLKNKLLVALSLFFYASNFYLYLYPTLAMAENLLLAVFLLNFKHSLKKGKNKFYFLIAGILSLIMYGVKYSAAPMTLAFSFIYLFKIIKAKINKKQKLKFAFYFITGLIIALPFSQGFRLFEEGWSLFSGFFTKDKIVQTIVQKKQQTDLGWKSIHYIPKIFPLYWQALTGKDVSFLWHYGKLLPSFLALTAIIGLILMLSKKRRFSIASSLVLILTQIIFLSTFYTFQARYILHFVPILIFWAAYSFQEISKFLLKNNQKIISLIILIIFSIYSFQNFKALKAQLALNFKYAETPWYYLAIKNANQFFEENHQDFQKKPLLISAQIPYLFDLYPSEHYVVIPLSDDQDFTKSKRRTAIWGQEINGIKINYENLPEFFTQLLKANNNLFISNAGLGRSEAKHQDFAYIQQNFKLSLVKEACLGSCNIYQLELIP